MASRKPTANSDPEITAIGLIHNVLRELDPVAQQRILKYVAGKLGVPSPLNDEEYDRTASDLEHSLPGTSKQVTDAEASEGSEGISAVALKWMKRSGLTASSISSLFSLGLDEIDLVAENVPGTSKRERLHSVLLLKGIAAYLSTGAPRVSHEQLKEASLHYDSFDSTNFSTHLKSFSSEVGGSKELGYTLTARGLMNATEIIKKLVTAKT